MDSISYSNPKKWINRVIRVEYVPNKPFPPPMTSLFTYLLAKTLNTKSRITHRTHVAHSSTSRDQTNVLHAEKHFQSNTTVVYYQSYRKTRSGLDTAENLCEEFRPRFRQRHENIYISYVKKTFPRTKLYSM